VMRKVFFFFFFFNQNLSSKCMLSADLAGGSCALLNDAKGRVHFAYLWVCLCAVRCRTSCRISVHCLRAS